MEEEGTAGRGVLGFCRPARFREGFFPLRVSAERGAAGIWTRKSRKNFNNRFSLIYFHFPRTSFASFHAVRTFQASNSFPRPNHFYSLPVPRDRMYACCGVEAVAFEDRVVRFETKTYRKYDANSATKTRWNPTCNRGETRSKLHAKCKSLQFGR